VTVNNFNGLFVDFVEKLYISQETLVNACGEYNLLIREVKPLLKNGYKCCGGMEF